jgi:hypothetical protein
VHETAAEEIAEGVGVVGEDDLSHLGLRAGYGTHRRVGFSRAHQFTYSIFRLLGLQGEFTSGYNGNRNEPFVPKHQFQFRQSTSFTQIALVQKSHYEHNGQDRRTERDSRP